MVEYTKIKQPKKKEKSLNLKLNQVGWLGLFVRSFVCVFVRITIVRAYVRAFLFSPSTRCHRFLRYYVIFISDEPDPDLWVKRDMPSPKRSPKSPHKPPTPINTETEHIKTDSKPMSPITRAATLPKPWSPSAPTSRSLPRKYSFEYKPSGSDEAKEELRTTRKQSINEEKEESVEKTVKETSGEEGPQKR